MKLDIDFRGLERVCKIMGASKSKWESKFVRAQREKFEFKQTLSSSGHEVKYDDIKIVHNGLLSYNGEQVVIYIKEVAFESKNNLITGALNKMVKSFGRDPESLRRFHMVDCGTIDGMKTQGRYHRYFATDRKDGKFIIDTRGNYDIEEKLFPCINCLKKLNYKNYNNSFEHQQKIRNFFDIEEFFKSYKDGFKDKARKG